MILNRPVLLLIAIAAGLFLQYGPVRPSVERSARAGCDSSAPAGLANAALNGVAPVPASVHMKRMDNGDLLLIARFPAERPGACGQRL